MNVEKRGEAAAPDHRQLTIRYNNYPRLRQNVRVRVEPHSSDPFRCYVGRLVSVEAHPHVVECYELHGCDLLFRLRQVGSGRERRVTVLELLDLLEKQGS